MFDLKVEHNIVNLSARYREFKDKLDYFFKEINMNKFLNKLVCYIRLSKKL
jgi:hypothetical protein